jgi:hypothetical protein
MTYAITLIKGESGNREGTFNCLTKMKRQKDPFENTVRIKECFISFGWPDFILLMKGDNVELLKDAIIKLRKKVYEEIGDRLETSTIVCSTKKEVETAEDSIKSTSLRKRKIKKRKKKR